MRTPASVARDVVGWLNDLYIGRALTSPSLTSEQAAVADWLRGREAECESIRKLISARVEGRGLLPTPSNPHEVFVNAGRDAEARELSRLLLLLCKSPVASGSEELHEHPPDRELRWNRPV